MKYTLLGLVVALSVAGCSIRPTDNGIRVGGSLGVVELVTLPDGTKCAVLIGSYKGGIDCDWR